MACQQIDDLIDQALEGQIVEDTFMMEAHGSNDPAKGSSPVGKHVSQPLVHSVSMYRRNQRQLKVNKTTFETIIILSSSSLIIMVHHFILFNF